MAGWPLLAKGEPAAALRFPADFGAHPETRTEWWYVTGTLTAGARLWGFQVTFFRSATGITSTPASRFAASQLLFAHAALTDLEGGRLRHDQRIARSGFGIAQAGTEDTDVVLRDWQLNRAPLAGDAQRSRYTTRIASDGAGFRFALQFDTMQPVLTGVPETVHVILAPAATLAGGVGEHDVLRPVGKPLRAQAALVAVAVAAAAFVQLKVPL